MALGPTKHIPTLDGASDTALQVETQRDFVNASPPGGLSAPTWWLKQHVWTAKETLVVSAFNDEMPQSGTVEWPDESAGVFTALAVDADRLYVYEFQITHADSSQTVTVEYTQDATTGVYHDPTITVT